MSILQKFETAIDRTIGIFFPRKEIYRKFYREHLTEIRSAQYAAAKTTRLTGSWTPIDGSVNTVIGNSLPMVRSRIRQLVRDFPAFSRAVEILVDYTVGPGIIFQSRVTDSEDRLDKKRIKQIEDAFNFWADQADVSGRLHYYEMMQLAKRQDIEPGEFLLIKTYLKDRKRYLPYALQMYEADWLTSWQAQPAAKTNRIEQGIEYDPATGQVVAYHFTDPDGWGKTKRISAENVVHGFKTLRPGQIRGISPFAPAVLLAKDLDSIMSAEIDAAKMASKYLAMVETPDPMLRQRGLGATTDSQTNKKIEELENAIIEYLRPGEKINIATNPRPGTNFPPFVRLILSMFAITAGVPYELVSGDYRGLTYSTNKMIRNDFAHQLRSVVTRHVRHFGMKTTLPFFETAVMAGKLDLPNFFVNPAPWIRSEWQPPGMESVDPLRETKAKIDEVNSGLRSPQEIVKARGRDLEEIYKEIKQAEEMASELELNFAQVSTALANNPAAIDGSDNGNGNGEASKSLEIQLTELRDAIENFEELINNSSMGLN